MHGASGNIHTSMSLQLVMVGLWGGEITFGTGERGAFAGEPAPFAGLAREKAGSSDMGSCDSVDSI